MLTDKQLEDMLRSLSETLAALAACINQRRAKAANYTGLTDWVKPTQGNTTKE
jgi:hypothetical protein